MKILCVMWIFWSFCSLVLLFFVVAVDVRGFFVVKQLQAADKLDKRLWTFYTLDSNAYEILIPGFISRFQNQTNTIYNSNFHSICKTFCFLLFTTLVIRILQEFKSYRKPQNKMRQSAWCLEESENNDQSCFS